MKKLDFVNPENVVNVDFLGMDKIKEGNYAYIVKLVTKETVIMKYNPLLCIKQFICFKWCIISDIEDSDINVSKCEFYVNYYGNTSLNIIDDVKNHYDINEVFDNKQEAMDRLDNYIKEQK